MTTDPGGFVLYPTCGCGITAYVAEKWGRRWITGDNSCVAVSLTMTRLTTAGFIYKTVPRVTLKSTAAHADSETLYDQPERANGKLRIAGSFSAETVPSPTVRSLVKTKEAHPRRTRREAARRLPRHRLAALRARRMAVKIVDDRGIESLKAMMLSATDGSV